MTSVSARIAAALIALIALVAIGWQFVAPVAGPGAARPLAQAWYISQYFTILTNALTAAVMAMIAFGHRPSDSTVAGTLLSIVMVGALSHALLAPEVPFTGIAYWIDFGYHTAVPLATAAWWLVWGGRAVELRQLPLWMVWPVAYCGYALLRGGLDGSYPYFFLDIGTFGLLPVVRNIVLVTLAFALAGLGIIGIARFAKHLTRHENRA